VRGDSPLIFGCGQEFFRDIYYDGVSLHLSVELIYLRSVSWVRSVSLQQ